MAQIASLLMAVWIAALVRLERDRSAGVSRALWLPAIWLVIGASRPVSLWFGLGPAAETADVYLEGSPFDRALLSGVLVAGFIVLGRRMDRLRGFPQANSALMVFFLF